MTRRRVAARPADGSRAFGSAAAFLSAFGFAANVVLVSLMYGHGGNIHAVNLVRPIFFVACVAAWIAIRRSAIRLPARQRDACIVLGGLFCIEFYGVHAAIRHIPVGLAVLLMYTYPLMVAVVASVLRRRAPSAALLAAMLVVFAGLSAALYTPGQAVEWPGVAYSLAAALGMCGVVTIGERTMAGQDRAAVMLHTMLAASVVMIAIVAAGPELRWPAYGTGMLALGGATVLYAAATCLLFVAVGLIGPLGFAAIDNTAPVWAALLGFALLGERLSGVQLAGVAIVIAGVTAIQLLKPPLPGR